MQNLGKYNLFYHKIEILFIDLLYDIQTIKRILKTQNDRRDIHSYTFYCR